MSNTEITLMIRDYDFVSPLICGDLAVEGIDLTVDRVPVEVDDLSHVEQSTQAAELSFGRYLIDIAENNFDFVGIPVLFADLSDIAASLFAEAVKFRVSKTLKESG